MEVTLIDYMGSDARVVDSARVSFSKIASNYTEEQNAKLIQYLAKHNHFTPFTHVMITMREKVPIFVARQRFKHMVGFTYNEVSRRYVDDAPEFFVPDVWRGKPINAKQGSSEEVITYLNYTDFDSRDEPFETKVKLTDEYKWFLESAERLYNKMIEDGVAPEQARMVLPQSMYTEYYVTGSLAAWARAYKLRSDPHAQKEIQELAGYWFEIISSIPELTHSWTALTSSSEKEALTQ